MRCPPRMEAGEGRAGASGRGVLRHWTDIRQKRPRRETRRQQTERREKHSRMQNIDRVGRPPGAGWWPYLQRDKEEEEQARRRRTPGACSRRVCGAATPPSRVSICRP